jgi:hypothetical protein
MTDEQQLDSVRSAIRQLSPADRSVLEAVVQSLESEETVRVTTTPGTANDRVWSEMAILGWMSIDTPLEVSVDTRVYIVEQRAKKPLCEMLLDIKRDGLPDLFNELRREIPAKIVPPVIASGGLPSDVSMMLAGIIERTLQNYINDELHEEMLQDIVRKVHVLQKQK